MPEPAPKPSPSPAQGVLRPGGAARAQALAGASLLLPMERAQIAERERLAQQVLENARREAAELIASAQARAQSIEAHARQQAEAAGAARLHELCADAHAQWTRAQVELRQRVLTAAVELARGILRRELTTDPEPFVTMVEEVLQRCGAASRVVVLLHPDQATLVGSARARMAQAAPLAGEFEVRAVATAAPWSIVVETEQGAFVGGVDAKLSVAHDAAARGAIAKGQP